MANIDFTWVGGVSGAFNNANNWSPTTRVPGSAGVAAPNLDSIYIPKTANNDITSGLNLTAANANAGTHFAVIHVAEDSEVAIGSSGNPLRCTTDNLVHAGLETFYYQVETGSAGSETTDQITLNSKNQTLSMLLSGSDDLGILNLMNGVLISTYTGALTELNIGSAIGAPHSRPKATFSDFSSFPTLIRMNAGFASFGETTGTSSCVLYLAGGIVECTASSSAPIAFITQLNGIVNWNTPAVVQTVWLMGGTLDFTKTSDTHALTVVYLWPGAQFRYSDALFSGTIVEMATGGI